MTDCRQWVRWTVLVLFVCAGCGSREPAALVQPPATAPQPSQLAPNQAIAYVRTVTLDGLPLPGVRPVATTTPNAFDKPLATGNPTDDAGEGAMVIPNDTRLYVRAWDPELKYFPNNFYDVPPMGASETPVMEIVMVRGASLDVALMRPDGTPVADTNVGIMMFHPSKGPWWPSEADTDETGTVHFPALPAGKYMIRLKALGMDRIDLPDVDLPPGGHTNLGPVTLQ